MANKVQYPRLTPSEVVTLKKFGFSHVVIVNRDVSVRVPGSVEACFRSLADAKRFATVLCRLYGATGGWVGVSI